MEQYHLFGHVIVSLVWTCNNIACVYGGLNAITVVQKSEVRDFETQPVPG